MKNTFISAFILPGNSEHSTGSSYRDRLNISIFLYMLHVLKHSGKMDAAYCFTDDLVIKDMAEEYGCKIIQYNNKYAMRTIDGLINFCLEKITFHDNFSKNVLLVHNFTDAFFRFPIADFLSVFNSVDYEVAFSAEKKEDVICPPSASAVQEGVSGSQAQQTDNSQSVYAQVDETGGVYAFSTKAMQNKKTQGAMRAKPILPLDSGMFLHAHKGSGHIKTAYPADNISESLRDILYEVRQLDGFVKSFMLSQNPVHLARGTGDASSVFPSGIQKFLIFLYAYFVWLVGGKRHYDRLKKDPAEFFRVTAHSINLLFLKLLAMLGPTPRN